MTARRSRIILLAAFVLSILLHAILAGALRWRLSPTVSDETAPLTKVRIIKIARMPTPPPPTPTPKAVPRPSAEPPVLSKSAKGTRPARVLPNVAQTSTPQPRRSATPPPTALPTPALGPCGGHENAEPAVAATPGVPEISPQARASKANGVAQIRVVLDPGARVTDASVAQSSGNAGLDAVAMQMARDATYTPKYVKCKAVAGTTTFSVRFWTW
jgi:TonB family protein